MPDEFASFENQQMRNLMVANTHIIKLNAALSRRVAELGVRVAELNAENIRLRISGITHNSNQYAGRPLELSLSTPLAHQELSRSRRNNKANPGLANLTDLVAIPETPLDTTVIHNECTDLEVYPESEGRHMVRTLEINQYDNPTNLTGLITRDNIYPIFGGGYADVYKGILNPGKESCQMVAVKVIRAHTYTEANRWKIDKRLRREIRVWARLQHGNILPLLGITSDFGPYTSMVCPWMEDGDMHNFLQVKEQTLTLSNRLDLLTDVSNGLSYLHERSIIHGDLTTGNILIHEGTACLSDFGLSTIVAEFQATSLMSSTVGGALRWAAPELYRAGMQTEIIPEITKPCDIYSFGSVMLQALSGRIPYDDISSDIQVLVEMMRGQFPRRPPNNLLSDEFWLFITSCWDNEPRSRPNIEAIRNGLLQLRFSCPLDFLDKILEKN